MQRRTRNGTATRTAPRRRWCEEMDRKLRGRCKNGRPGAAQFARLIAQSVRKTAACANWYDCCSEEVHTASELSATNERDLSNAFNRTARKTVTCTHASSSTIGASSAIVGARVPAGTAHGARYQSVP